MESVDIQAFGISDAGLKRIINQDAMLIRKSGDTGFFAIADGMGGHSHGEKASSELIASLSELWDEFESKKEALQFQQIVNEFTFKIEEANRIINEKYNKNDLCGTTLVGLLITRPYYALFSVGDSRIYSQKGFKLQQLTFDDIWDNLPEIREKMSPERIKESPNKGKLMRAVGINKEVEVHVSTGKIEPGQTFVVCSDGLYKYCKESFINCSIFLETGKKDLEKIAGKLFDRVLKNGARDNVSFILIAP